MVRYFCAPDLPFIETVTWYAKQTAANLIVVFGVFAVIGVCYLMIGYWCRK